MNPTESRELSIGELESVSGGHANIEGYKFCWFGPAGEGLYPAYANCGGGGTLMENMLNGAVDGAAEGM
jgi:hypothetical protein